MVKNLARDNLDDRGKLSRDVAQQSYKKDRTNIGSYEYLPNYSNDNTAVYKDSKTKNIKIGMRGSTTKGDWVRNTLIGVGAEGYDKDFKADSKLYDKLKNDFSDSKISTSGHSRGGKRARNLSFKKNIEGSSFNEASSPYSITQAYQNNYCKTSSCASFVSHRTKNDVVSGANKDVYGKKNNYDSVKGNEDKIGSHSMINFY